MGGKGREGGGKGERGFVKIILKKVGGENKRKRTFLQECFQSKCRKICHFGQHNMLCLKSQTKLLVYEGKKFCPPRAKETQIRKRTKKISKKNNNKRSILTMVNKVIPLSDPL